MIIRREGEEERCGIIERGEDKYILLLLLMMMMMLVSKAEGRKEGRKDRV